MNPQTVFIYHKYPNFKVLDPIDALVQQKMLLQDGWTHTATLNPAKWMEALLNGNKKEMIESLRKRD